MRSFFTFAMISICSSCLQINMVIDLSILYITLSFNEFIVYLYWNNLQFFQAQNMGRTLQFIGPGVGIVFYLFLFCHFGNLISERFSSINEEIYLLDWYNLPQKLQKILPTVILITQKESHLNVFGNMHCDYEVFAKVTFFNCLKKKYETFIFSYLYNLTFTPF